MAREVPPIETAVGFKTTTVRLPESQFEEVDLFCAAMNVSVTEFTRDALDFYVKHIAKDPKVRKAVMRRITRVTRMMDKIAARADGDTSTRITRTSADEE
jgi:hypothetical protein